MYHVSLRSRPSTQGRIPASPTGSRRQWPRADAAAAALAVVATSAAVVVAPDGRPTDRGARMRRMPA